MALLQPHLHSEMDLADLNILLANELTSMYTSDPLYKLAAYTCLMLTREVGGLDASKQKYTGLVSSLWRFVGLRSCEHVGWHGKESTGSERESDSSSSDWDSSSPMLKSRKCFKQQI